VTLYERAGGAPAIHRLSERFYELVFADDLLPELFRDRGEDHAGRLAMWLTELLGGPPEHTEARGGFAVMRGAHQGLRISEEQRQRWAALMFRACEEVAIPAAARRELLPYVEGGSTLAMRVSWPSDEIWPR
jgi:truncated hemoglobin YjbI